ncbi:carbamoyltransferase HypF [Helicobacter sp. 12S02634-8]|nr:carbamoyltransferase HypF [Helicobacter sp. 12S02634-8]
MKILIKGIVQGVGFRPFVYRIAQDLGTKGWVKNLGGDVEVVLEHQWSEKFIAILTHKLPPHARIDSMQMEDCALERELEGFEIAKSRAKRASIESLLPKDIALCKDCLQEISDPKDRHYRYAFTTCAHCGPRYSIITALPYDRKNTTMAPFKMCVDCQREYDNPSDRRFGAQPNSCPKCAIELRFRDTNKQWSYDESALQGCIHSLKAGEIVAIKGVGGFALVCDSRNDTTLQRLRSKKHRPKKPFALMVKDLTMAQALTKLTQIELEILSSPAAPILLAPKRAYQPYSALIAPEIETLGIILPYSGIHHLLFASLDFPIVFTSANVGGEPIIASLEELEEKLGSVFDSVLDYPREIVRSIDDSVVSMLGGKMGVMRLGRGLAPLDIRLDITKSSKLCVGMGASQKSSLTYGAKNQFLIAPYIGDLTNPASMQRYENIFDFFKEFYALTPDVLCSDLHPDYHSSILSAKKSIQIPCGHIKLQHHLAHFYAVFAEAILQDNSITPQTQVLGIIWDGTGLGDDGSIWGGEFFLGSLQEAVRVGHFEKLPLIGGEAAIRKIYKIGYALALKHRINGLIERWEQRIPPSESQLLKTMLEKNINTIHTSSVGRLFDAVASWCGLLEENSYEGESGVLLESAAAKWEGDSFYDFLLEDGVVVYAPMLAQMQEDILSGATHKVAGKFINTLAQIAWSMSECYADRPVVFSGGVFQNRTLCDKIQHIFESRGRKFYMHRLLPPNDACISFGQAVYAMYQSGH